MTVKPSKIQFFYLLLFFFLMINNSCREKIVYPIEPRIEFMEFTKIQTPNGIDSKGILKFSFTDGDGDIGLAQSDTLPPFNPEGDYYYNLFITYYEKQNGNYVKINLPLTNNSRIPVVTPKGRNKSIKGEMEIELFINNPFSRFDTIMYEFYILDRALHKSNTARTSDIIVKKI